MAIAWGSNIEYKKDEKTRYVEEDNIKDVTEEDLKTLKSTLKLDEETDLDAQLIKINDNVEDIFDWFIMNKRETSVTLTKADGTTITDTPQNIIKEWVQVNLDALANYVIDNSGYVMDLDKLKDAEIKAVLKDYIFELKDLRKTIAADSGTGEVDWNGNALLNNLGEWTVNNKETIKYESANNYVDPYKKTGVPYAAIGKDMDIANIYKDNKLPKYMEEMFDDEEKKELHKWTFKINLGKEDGLAGIIIAIREAVKIGQSEDADTESNEYKLYEKLNEKGILVSEDPIDIKISTKQLKELIDLWLLTYESGVALSFNEKGKVAKILTESHRSELDTFASLLQSESDEAMAVKEWHNADEMIKNKLINADNVLAFLCDFNSDGQVATEYKKKNNKEQKNQWDVGTLFGQQVMFTIEQAIKVKNIELGDPAGEQLVISNIIKNMQISDSRELDEVQKLPFTTMEWDITKCTTENLAKLFNGDEEEGILPMPEMKTFFLSSIKKINGWSEEVNPDLYDTLIGEEAESVISLYESEASLKTQLDKILTESKDPTIVEMIRLNGLVRVRETIFTKIMTAIDEVEITTNDGNSTRLKAAWVSKWRETRELKKELLESTIKSLISTWIKKGVWWWYIFGIGYGKSWTSGKYWPDATEKEKSKYGKTKRSRWVWAGLERDWSPWWEVGLNINLSGEYDIQYNKNKVINASLSDVKSAKYIGVDGWAVAGIGLKNANGVELEASAGIDRQKDPVVGINQIDMQYRAVSEEIFDVTWASAATLSDKTAFRALIKGHIDSLKIDGVYGKFVTNNEQHLTDDLDFMVRYMDANKFFGTTGVLAKFPKANITSSINALVDIIQSGNIEQRRHDVIANLHGKISLTKLSFGVTTNALTLKSKWGKGTTAPVAGVVNWETPEWWDINSWGSWSEVDLGDSRFWICGFYIGLRISTWKNSYVPNEAQYLFTQYEMWQGIWAKKFDNPGKDLDTYGKYLEALYNDPENRLSCKKDTVSNTLMITFDPKWSDLTLAKFLNIHATTEAQKSFSLKGNVLTIGNVGDMAAYTTTEAKGVCRILCLGTKKLDEATRVTWDIWATTVDPMKPVAETNKARTQEKLKTVITTMTGEWVNVETAKKETAAFFDADGKLITPTGTEWTGKKITFEPATLVNTPIKQGTLLIQKNADGLSYTITLDKTTPAKELTIIYRDKAEYDAALLKEQQKPENRAAVTSTEVKTLFSFAEGDMSKAKTEIALLLTSLEELENTSPQDYADFLLDASTSDNGKIDDEQLSLAIVHLEILMAKDKNPTTFTTLKWFLDGKNGEVKSYIVDRMKQILAREPSYKTMTIWAILWSHTWWEKVSWPTSALPVALQTEMKTKRAELKKTYAKEKYSTDPTIDPNLIWFTAFYRPLAQKYSLTSLGETWYQWALTTITENKDLAQKWFLENLVNTYEINRLASSLEAQFLAQWSTVDILKDTTKETLATLELLMQWKEITIDSWDKISIDMDWVFYLLGDCCNESLGMKIKNIKIQKFTPGTVVAWRYAATWIPDKEYTWGMELYTKSHSITNRVITKEERASFKHHKGIEKKPTANVTSWEGDGTWWWTTEWWVIESGNNSWNE